LFSESSRQYFLLFFYLVTLSSAFVVQGQDLGMLPPHGVNTSAFVGGSNYIGYPYQNDVMKQAAAAAANSVTALTEPDASPIGFKTDILRYEYSICVRVKNVYNRWVEIMAQTPSSEICVTDWNKAPSNTNPARTSCGKDYLYTCRQSGNNQGADNMMVRFYCGGADCDSMDYSFKWRIMARYVFSLHLFSFTSCW
jgi:hypothetical protein